MQDSIFATQKKIEETQKKTISQMPTLAPKDEYEKQAEFDARRVKWEKELDEKIQRDSKSLLNRLAEFEKAKKKIEENQALLYCTIDIKTSPEAASIYLNKVEIGASPAEYRLALPGYTVIRIQKENYEPWDTTLTLQPAQKLKINVMLQEKSIFSKEGEIDFPKTLAKDTSVAGYRKRIGRVNARISQIDYEIRAIIADCYDDMRQVDALQRKYETYRNKLLRSLRVLEDNIISAESQLITETPLNAKITLGTYDVEKEVFEIEIQDTANAKTPFYFAGRVSVPRDTAKIMNRSSEGFLASIGYISYPFVSNDSSFNLAMKEISISRKVIPLRAEGAFKQLGRFEAMEGYDIWKLHADSLLSGALKPQGLDLNYALKEEIAKKATGDGSSMDLRKLTRIFTFTATAALGALAVMKHSEVTDYTQKYKTELNKNPQDYTELKKNFDAVRNNEKDRNTFGIGAGVFAVVGTLTFIF